MAQPPPSADGPPPGPVLSRRVDGFQRHAVPRARPPLFGLRAVLVLVLATLVAVWLQRAAAPPERPTMTRVNEPELRVVELPEAFVRPTLAPEPSPLIPAGLSPEERDRRLEAATRQPNVEYPVAPPLPGAEEPVPYMTDGPGPDDGPR